MYFFFSVTVLILKYLICAFCPPLVLVLVNYNNPVLVTDCAEEQFTLFSGPSGSLMCVCCFIDH